VAGLTPAQKTDLRQLAGAGAYSLWLGLYAAGSSEDKELTALVARNAGNLQLAAVDMLDGVIDGAASIKRVKIEGELDVEFNPVTYANKAAGLRSQVALAAGQARRFGPPLAGMLTGRSPAPQVFALGDENLPAGYQRLGGPVSLTGREEP